MHEFKTIDGYAVPEGHVLVLRTSGADGRSLHRDAGGFQWPDVGGVAAAPDWNPAAVCGGGLHGALWGEGDGEHFSWEDDALWRCVEVEASSVVDLRGKVKFPRGRVVATGGRADVTRFIRRHGARGAVIGLVCGVGDGATVVGGERATVTGGDYATVTGGDWSTVTGGRGATVTGGHHAAVTGGHYAAVTGGDYATVTGGHDAAVTGGYGATVAGGYGATLEIVQFDGRRRRRHVAYVGETHDVAGAVMEPGVAYRWDDGWVRA